MNENLKFAEAARAVARSAGLDAKLDALAELAQVVTGAPALICVHDPAAGLIVPAARSASGAPEAPTPLRVDARDIAAVALRERRTKAGGEKASRLFNGAVPAGGAVVARPLVSVDGTGGEQAEGVLLTAHASAIEQEDSFLDTLAELGAISVRESRLEQALTEQSEWLNQLATTDALTGLANRRAFERMLELELARARRQETAVSVVVFDVVGLGAIQQRAGGEVADNVLRRVSTVLAQEIRLIDTVARIGGDEFAVIAPGPGGEIVARRVDTSIAQIEALPDQHIALHHGVALFPGDAENADGLIAAASRALESTSSTS
jgi:diguanylate cyclase (GGDEF)-like protein